jgi:branched-chain amino acid transport system permease protein
MASFVALGIFTGLIYSLVAIGYTLVYGVLRLINFAHSEVLMSGDSPVTTSCITR